MLKPFEVIKNIWKTEIIYAWWWHRSLHIVLLARILRKKIIVTGAIHAFDLSGAPAFYTKSLLYKLLNILSLKLATVNVCISEHQKQSINMLINTKKLALLYPSVDKHYDEDKFEAKINKQIIAISWLTNEQCIRKGIYKIVYAIGALRENNPRILNETKFIIAGKDGDGVGKLNELINQFGLNEIIGVKLNLSSKEKYALLSSSDLLLAPSSMEGFGNATLEAMSVGVPALVTSEGASKEVVGQSGHIALGIEFSHISDELSKYLSLSDREKCNLKHKALYRANNYFSFNRRVSELRKITRLHQIIKEPVIIII